MLKRTCYSDNMKDGKEVVNVTNPNVYVEEAQMAFEDTYLKK